MSATKKTEEIFISNKRLLNDKEHKTETKNNFPKLLECLTCTRDTKENLVIENTSRQPEIIERGGDIIVCNSNQLMDLKTIQQVKRRNCKIFLYSCGASVGIVIITACILIIFHS